MKSVLHLQEVEEYLGKATDDAVRFLGVHLRAVRVKRQSVTEEEEVLCDGAAGAHESAAPNDAAMHHPPHQDGNASEYPHHKTVIILQ